MSEFIDQRSADWFSARAGSLGASQVHDALAKTTTGWAASRADVLTQLVIERLAGPQPTFSNSHMQWGVDTEPQARAAYGFLRDVDVQEVGLYRHPFITHTHASPDGMVGDDGIVEIKCPKSSTHLETLMTKTIPARYMTQMQWQMACTGREWCDFVSFDPRFPPHLQLFVQRVERDGMRIMELELMVADFLVEVDQALERLSLAVGEAP